MRHSHLRSRLASGFLAAWLVFSVFGAGRAAAVVDPSNLVSAGNLSVGVGQDVGQTLSVRLTGRLTGIEVAPTLDSASPSDQVFLEVFDGVGQSLGTVSITVAGFPPGTGNPAPLVLGSTGPGFFDVESLGIDVSENDNLAFELSKSGGDIRVGISTNVYADGTVLVNRSPNSSFDLAFKIFINPIPKLLVGAANGQNVKAYDGETGASQGDFSSGGPTTLGPSGLALGPNQGSLYVKPWSGTRIDEYDGITGQFVQTLVSSGVKSGGGDMTIGPDGHLYGSSVFDGVSRWNASTGALIGTFVAPGSGGLENVGGVLFGPLGKLYVGSLNFGTNIHEVLRYDGTTGAFIDVFVSNGSGGLKGPNDFVFGEDGDLYVASRTTGNVLRYDGTSGAFVGVFASGGGLGTVWGLAFGPDGNLYVANHSGNEVLRYSGDTGAFIDVFATSTNPAPTHILFTEGELPPPPPPPTPPPVPGLGPWGLGLVTLILLGLAKRILTLRASRSPPRASRRNLP